MNALLILFAWLYNIHAESTIDHMLVITALKSCVNFLQHDEVWKSKIALHHPLKTSLKEHRTAPEKEVPVNDGGLAVSDCYMTNNHCYYKDFCIFSCDLLSKSEKESPMEVFQRLSNRIQVIGNTIAPTEYNKMAFLIYSKLASNYYQDTYSNNQGSKDFLDLYDFSLLSIDVLTEIVAKYQFIFLDFNTELTCGHALLELLFFSQRYLLVNDNSNRLQAHCEVSLYVHFLSPALAMQEKVFAALAKGNQQLKLVAKFAYNFATNHLTLEQRCVHLYKYYLRHIHVIKIISDAANNSTTTVASPNNSNKPPFTIVISRFKEPLQSLAWIGKYPNYINDRGLTGGLVPNGLHVYRDGRNAGKESSVYLNYIISNYDSLPKLIVFSQAAPTSNLYSMKKMQADMQWLNEQQGILRPENDGFAFLGEHQLPLQINGDPTHLMQFLSEIGNFTAVNRYFAPGGMFVVSREAVQRHSKAHYVRLVRLVTYAKFTSEGYTFERVWPAIFASKCAVGGFDDCMMRSIAKDQDECPPCTGPKLFQIV